MKNWAQISTTILLVLVALTLFGTCKKEYSYEGGANAEYDLVGSPQACVQPVINGVFYKGVALDTSQTVSVLINISKPGNYNFTTGVVNGISFTASGVFADTSRNRYIKLIPTGKPIESGAFSYNINGSEGCNFTLVVNDVADAEFTLAGSPADCENPDLQGRYNQGVGMNSNNTISLSVDVIKPGKYKVTTDTVNGVSFRALGIFTTPGVQNITLSASGTADTSALTYYHLITAYTSCGFYVPFAPTGQIATYVLQSAIDNNILACTPSSVQGTYIAGESLNNVNSITINSYITVPGKYTISTKTIDGFYFAKSGTFTNTGAQDVVLQGFGVPALRGNFVFIPQIVGEAPLGGSSCGVSINIQ